MRTTQHIALTLGLFGLLIAAGAPADQGTVPKWSQHPENMLGENIPSTIDWRDMGPDPIAGGSLPNWNVADDFRSDGRPILTVRWWGSYFDEINQPQPLPDGGFVPVVEDTFVLSFFADVPAPAGGFSMPGTLLGTYIAPIPAVRIDPTPLIGWDQHQVWQYEVNLQDTHLDHPSPLATPISFDEVAGTIYWISITAANGHELAVSSDGTQWLFGANSDPLTPEHWWGWHTSPDAFNDSATMSRLGMSATGDWDYMNWQPIEPIHGLDNMAFELLTIPLPGALWLFAPALAGLGLLRQRDSA